MAHPLDGPLLKIHRAHEHIGQLEAEIDRFNRGGPHRLSAHFDSQTGDFLVRVIPSPYPLGWATIAGDAIHNGRSALDLLACQLMIRVGKENLDNIYFPIGKDSHKLLPGKIGRIAEAGDDAMDIIGRLRPYKGGNDDLWKLHTLDIADKHRLLIPVRGKIVGISGDILKPFADELSRARPGESITTFPYFGNIHEALPPDEETVVFRMPAASMKSGQPGQMGQFNFDVVFGGPEIVKGLSILPTLSQLIGAVRDALERFRVLF